MRAFQKSHSAFMVQFLKNQLCVEIWEYFYLIFCEMNFTLIICIYIFDIGSNFYIEIKRPDRQDFSKGR